MHLLLKGEASLIKNIHTLNNDNKTLMLHKDTARVFKPQMGVLQKVFAMRNSGTFLETQIISLDKRRSETAVVESECALTIKVDLNILLSLDRTYALINAYNSTMTMLNDVHANIEKELQQKGTANIEEPENAAAERLKIDESILPLPKDLIRSIQESCGIIKEKDSKQGINTLITRVKRLKRNKNENSESFDGGYNPERINPLVPNTITDQMAFNTLGSKRSANFIKIQENKDGNGRPFR